MGKWRMRAAETAVALVIAYTVIQVSTLVAYRNKLSLPADSWFEVQDIFVPDHASGSDPTLIYDRVIHEEFQGFWIVEVQRIEENGQFSMVCSGSGVNDYEPNEIIPDDQVSWTWMIGRECAVPEGVYRLRVSYTMRRPGWPEKEVLAVSNSFSVTS